STQAENGANSLIEIVASLPCASVPSSHCTAPATRSQEPWVVSADLNESSGGSTSLRKTSSAASGPLLPTTVVKTSSPSPSTGSRCAFFLTYTSAFRGGTVPTHVSPLTALLSYGS